MQTQPKHKIKIRIPAYQKQDTTRICGQLLLSLLGLLQLSLFTFCFLQVFAIHHSPAFPQILFLLFLIFFSLSPSSQCSSFLCSLTNPLLDATWAEFTSLVPRFFLPMFLSLYPLESHSQSPSLSLFITPTLSPFPLHPDYAKFSPSLHLSHQNTNIINLPSHTIYTHI